jgi:LemA protein
VRSDCAISEKYPDLKSSQNFLVLQSQLEGTRAARLHHRSEGLHTELRTIPGRWWRKILYHDAEPMQNFNVTEETTKRPEVKS